MTSEAKLLRVLRAERDLSQAQVAYLAGMSQAKYSQIERGGGMLATDDQRQAIADALEVTVDDIAWPTQPVMR